MRKLEEVLESFSADRQIQLQARANELMEIFKENDVTISGCVRVVDETDLVYRLRKRAEIRRQIASRKSVQEGKPDRIADLLEEAANEIEKLRSDVERADMEAAGADW
jgi:hypothetical protein